MKYITVDEYLKAKKAGYWKKISDETWFDWFGDEKSLPNKAKRLAGFTTRIIKKYVPITEYKKWEIFYKETVPMWTHGFAHTGWVQRKDEKKVYWFSVAWGDKSFSSGDNKHYGARTDMLKIKR